MTSLTEITNWIVATFCIFASLETFAFTFLNDEKFITYISFIENEFILRNDLSFEAIDQLHLIVSIEIFEKLDMVKVP